MAIKKGLHYVLWHFGDYARETGHLTELEDLAYRRMLDLYYIHEKPLPHDVDVIAVQIRMRERHKIICFILKGFFIKTKKGWKHKRAEREIKVFRQNSLSAKKSADKRWAPFNKWKESNKDGTWSQFQALFESNANALRTHCEPNANHNHTQTHNQTHKQNIKIEPNFIKPSFVDVYEKMNASEKCKTLIKLWGFDPYLQAEKFINHYESVGWVVGARSNQMKSWRHCVQQWMIRYEERAKNGVVY